jgi:adenylate kinase
MFLIFLGAPGAGKGTQASVVAQQIKIAHISSGDLFREAVKKESELGKLVKGYMEQGKLVPDEITIKMISERLKEKDCNSGAIFDGFPRTIEQAKALDKALSEQKKKIDYAVYIDVPDSDLLKRLGGRWTCQQCQTVYHETASPPKKQGICDKCGGKLYQRPDDNEATIKERLKVFHSQTTPLLDYYRAGGKLLNVDGRLSIDDVRKQIIKALKQ